MPSGTTYRWHTVRLTAEDIAVYTGLYPGLAQPADHITLRWQEMFLPMRLREQVAGMTVRRPQRREIPLAASERLLVPTTRPPQYNAPPERLLNYLLVGTVLEAGFLSLAGLAPRRRAAHVGSAGLSAARTLFPGSGELILIGLWALTDREIAYRNANVLQFRALVLALVLSVPALALGVQWAGRAAVQIAWTAAGLSALGFLLQASPGLRAGDHTGPPLLLRLALALRRLQSARRFLQRGEVDPAAPHPPARGGD